MADELPTVEYSPAVNIEALAGVVELFCAVILNTGISTLENAVGKVHNPEAVAFAATPLHVILCRQICVPSLNLMYLPLEFEPLESTTSGLLVTSDHAGHLVAVDGLLVTSDHVGHLVACAGLLETSAHATEEIPFVFTHGLHVP